MRAIWVVYELCGACFLGGAFLVDDEALGALFALSKALVFPAVLNLGIGRFG